MTVELTPDQIALARQGIEAGRLNTEEDVVAEALALWEARERNRTEIIASLEEARKEIAEGKGIPITPDSMQDLVARVAERGRKRLEAERAATA